ncbi:MAG: bifunctional metallophosphatase/5'-nucleotidase [Turicibacter sp.]|nr:bifunctional metallophosphatase/5'-nucleotidase [Turicibacter sp.]
MPKLRLLHTNDMHSYLDDFARLAYLVNKIRDEHPDTLLFDAGDSVSGSIYYNLYEGKKEATFMTLLGYDAMTLGNHDFDRGTHGVLNFISSCSVPVISSNIDFSRDEALPELPNYLIKNNWGIFALTTLETIEKAEPSPETVFKNPLNVAKEMVAHLKGLQLDGIILLSHLGKSMDERLALAVPGIDVIIGGHTHDVLYEPIRVGDTFILQAGCHGKFLGEFSLDLSDRSYIAKIHDIDGKIPEDKAFEPLIRGIQKERDRFSSRVIAEAAFRLDGDRAQIKTGETNLGNLVIDAYFQKAKNLGYQPDCAILNGLGIRTSLEKGPISIGDLVKVLPYSKSLMILECTGAQIKAALQHGLYPQVSQLSLTFCDGQLTRVLLHGDPLRDDQRYRVATNTFCGSGKDGFDAGFDDAVTVAKNLVLDIDLLAEYMISLLQPIRYGLDGRLIYLSKTEGK